MRKIACVLLLSAVISVPANAVAQQWRSVYGRVLAGDDGMPVIGATVRGLGFLGSANTDHNGAFTLDQVPRLAVRVVAEAAGFVPDTVTVTSGLGAVTIVLGRDVLELPPVVVTADAPSHDRTRFDSTTQVSAITIQAADIVNIPGMFEPDVIRAVQLLPGTIAKNDYSISYNVRGGEGDQNLVLLDGITVFNPSHLGGLFSTFDANAVARVDFFTGGFPASYPGRLSSVLDVSLEDGRRDGLHGGGHVSLLSSKMLLEGPLGPATFLVGARRTYADKVVSTFTRHEMPYYFADAVAKLNLPFRSGGSLALTGYWGRDDLDVNVVSATDETDPYNEPRTPIDMVVNWGNRLAGMTFRWPLPNGVFETKASVTDFHTTLAITPDMARWENGVRLLSARSDVTFAPMRHHQLHLLSITHKSM